MSTELNDGHIHEVLDRLHVLNCHLEDHVLSHPLIAADDEFTAAVNGIISRISDLYQKVGALDSIAAWNRRADHIVDVNKKVCEWKRETLIGDDGFMSPHDELRWEANLPKFCPDCGGKVEIKK